MKLKQTKVSSHHGDAAPSGEWTLSGCCSQSVAILQLLASKDKTLLVWGNAFFILNLGLHIFNSVWGLHFQSDGFACQGLHRDLHATSQTQNKMEGGLSLGVVVRQCDQRFPSPGLSWSEPAFHPGGPWKMTVQMLGLSCRWETVQGWRKRQHQTCLMRPPCPASLTPHTASLGLESIRCCVLSVSFSRGFRGSIPSSEAENSNMQSVLFWSNWHVESSKMPLVNKITSNDVDLWEMSQICGEMT